jgi:type IV pilus assembly protein PilW
LPHLCRGSKWREVQTIGGLSMTPTNWQGKTLPLRGERGLSLVELLVSLAIGLILVVAASSVYLYSKQAFNASTETATLEENGRFAINLLTRYIQSGAGSNVIEAPLSNKVSGCDFGLVNPTTASAASDLGCKSSTPTGQRRSESLAVFFETDPYIASGGSYEGYNCVGGQSTSMPTAAGGTTNLTRSYFFVSYTNTQTANGTTQQMGQLSCLADKTPSTGVFAQDTQPLIPGIEQIAFRYVLPNSSVTTSAQASKAASAVTAAEWPTVLAVDVCILAKTIQSSGNDTGTTYRDCYGNSISPAMGEVYRVFRSTVKLRNGSA